MQFRNPTADGLSPAISVTSLTRFPQRCCLLLAVGLAVSSVWAADDEGRPKRPNGGFQKRLLEQFDANKDGRLSETELAKARAAMARRQREAGAAGFNRRELMKRFDKDRDGRLNEEERRKALQASRGTIGLSQRPGGMLPGSQADRREVLKRFDKDGNGTLDQTERAAAKAAFEQRLSAGAAGPDGLRPERSRTGPPNAARRSGEFLKRFDKDGNGKLDATERAAAKAAFDERQRANRPGISRAAPVTAKADTGRVDKQQLLKEFDTDGDGQLTGKERAAVRKAFEARRGKDAKQ